LLNDLVETDKMPAPSLATVTLYFLRLGLTGFGGPVALANYIRRDLVERYGWLAADEYDEGLAIATACPGPLAYQLGVYCGFVMHGLTGAIAVALAFAAAPFAIVVGIAALYVRFGSTWQLRGIFYGVGPVVIALIVRSCWDLGRKTLRTDWLAYVFAVVACAITIAIQQELTVLFLAAGALGIVLFYKRDAVNVPGESTSQRKSGDVKLSAVPPLAVAYQIVALPKIFWFFFKTGFLVFGSGLVVVPFLKAYVVDQYHWLSNQAFLDAVAVGIVSPGPVVITATFVGYLTHGLSGAVAATAGMFTPSLLFVLIGTPLLRKYRTNGRLQGFIRGVTVAVVGVLVGTSFLIARSSLRDWISVAVFVAALALLWSKWKVPEQILIAGGALFGLATLFVTSTN
jgi:chromate transporter